MLVLRKKLFLMTALGLTSIGVCSPARADYGDERDVILNSLLRREDAFKNHFQTAGFKTRSEVANSAFAPVPTFIRNYQSKDKVSDIEFYAIQSVRVIAKSKSGSAQITDLVFKFQNLKVDATAPGSKLSQYSDLIDLAVSASFYAAYDRALEMGSGFPKTSYFVDASSGDGKLLRRALKNAGFSQPQPMDYDDCLKAENFEPADLAASIACLNSETRRYTNFYEKADPSLSQDSYPEY